MADEWRVRMCFDDDRPDVELDRDPFLFRSGREPAFARRWVEEHHPPTAWLGEWYSDAHGGWTRVAVVQGVAAEYHVELPIHETVAATDAL